MTADRLSAWTYAAARSVLVRMTEDGWRLGTPGIANSPRELRAQNGRADKSPELVLEAT